MIVSKTPLTLKADNAEFKSYHLGTSVHSNCLSTAATHVKDILPLFASKAIMRSSWTYTDAHIRLLCLLGENHDKVRFIFFWYVSIVHPMRLFMSRYVYKQNPNKWNLRARASFTSLKEKWVSPDILSLRDK